jgi:CxxC motif-containing protein
MTRNLTCIVCPKGCPLTVELEGEQILSISGHTCRRGEEYARTECIAPMRTLTTTVALVGGGVLPVKTDRPIPKKLLFACMEAVNAACAHEDTRLGDVVIENILGTGANLVATKDAK